MIALQSGPPGLAGQAIAGGGSASRRLRTALHRGHRRPDAAEQRMVWKFVARASAMLQMPPPRRALAPAAEQPAETPSAMPVSTSSPQPPAASALELTSAMAVLQPGDQGSLAFNSRSVDGSGQFRDASTVTSPGLNPGYSRVAHDVQAETSSTAMQTAPAGLTSQQHSTSQQLQQDPMALHQRLQQPKQQQQQLQHQPPQRAQPTRNLFEHHQQQTPLQYPPRFQHQTTLQRPTMIHSVEAAVMRQIKSTTSWVQLSAILDELGPKLSDTSFRDSFTSSDSLNTSSSTFGVSSSSSASSAQPAASMSCRSDHSLPHGAKPDSSSLSSSPSPASSGRPPKQLNITHLSAMLVQFAKMKRYRRFTKYEDSAPLQLAESLATAVRPLLPTAGPRHLSNILWALGKLAHHPGHSFTEAALSISLPQLPDFDEIGLSQTLWALATLNHAPGPVWLAAFWQTAGNRLHSFSPQSISNILWASAVLQLTPPPTFITGSMQAVLRDLGSHKAQGLSNSAWAFAKLGVHPGAAWLDAVVAEAARQMPSMLSQDVANLLWALAKLQHFPDTRFVAALLRHAHSIMPSFAPEELSSMLWALVTLQVRPPQAWLCTVLESAGCRLSTFKSREVATFLWGLASLGMKPDGKFVHMFFFHTAPKLCYFSAQDCANTLWALAALRLRPPEPWLQAFVEESFTQLPYCAPQHFSNLTYAFAKLGRLPPVTWQDRFFLETRSQLLAFKASELAQMVYAFGIGNISPPRQWMAQLLLASHAKAGALTPQGLSNLVWGLSRIGYRPNDRWLADVACIATELAPRMQPRDLSTVQAAYAAFEFPLGDFPQLVHKAAAISTDSSRSCSAGIKTSGSSSSRGSTPATADVRAGGNVEQQGEASTAMLASAGPGGAISTIDAGLGVSSNAVRRRELLRRASRDRALADAAPASSSSTSSGVAVAVNTATAPDAVQSDGSSNAEVKDSSFGGAAADIGTACTADQPVASVNSGRAGKGAGASTRVVLSALRPRSPLQSLRRRSERSKVANRLLTSAGNATGSSRIRSGIAVPHMASNSDSPPATVPVSSAALEPRRRLFPVAGGQSQPSADQQLQIVSALVPPLSSHPREQHVQVQRHTIHKTATQRWKVKPSAPEIIETALSGSDAVLELSPPANCARSPGSSAPDMPVQQSTTCGKAARRSGVTVASQKVQEVASVHTAHAHSEDAVKRGLRGDAVSSPDIAGSEEATAAGVMHQAGPVLVSPAACLASPALPVAMPGSQSAQPAPDAVIAASSTAAAGMKHAAAGRKPHSLQDSASTLQQTGSLVQQEVWQNTLLTTGSRRRQVLRKHLAAAAKRQAHETNV